MWHFKLYSHTTYNYRFLIHMLCGIENSIQKRPFHSLHQLPIFSSLDMSFREWWISGWIPVLFISLFVFVLSYILLQFLLFFPLISVCIEFQPRTYSMAYFISGWSQNAIHPHRNLLFIFFLFCYFLWLSILIQEKKN